MYNRSLWIDLSGLSLNMLSWAGGEGEGCELCYFYACKVPPVNCILHLCSVALRGMYSCLLCTAIRYFCIELALSFKEKAWPPNQQSVMRVITVSMKFSKCISNHWDFVSLLYARASNQHYSSWMSNWQQSLGLDSKTTCLTQWTLLEVLTASLPI